MVQSSEIMSTIVPMEGQSSNHLEMSEGVLYSLFFSGGQRGIGRLQEHTL